MPALNHTIAGASDCDASALFLSEILDLPAPVRLGHFAVVQVSEDTTIDFVTVDEVQPQHYAFLVSETEFDTIFDRIAGRDLAHWSDPFRRDPGQINRWDDGRGVYFDDPDGHLLEIITRPYGSAGTDAEHPHPLIAPTVSGDAGPE